MTPNTRKAASDPVAQALNALMRDDRGRLIASLIALLGDFQLAEDALQDATESALVHWARNGTPRSPAGWLLQTARRKAIDRIRRHRNFESKSAEYALLLDAEQDAPEILANEEIPDERLRLIFTCCHPALDEKSRVTLTLRTLGGLTTPEIARAFLDTEKAMAQRLVRAKRKIKQAGIPYAVPDADAWADRLESVLSVTYLIFNEGYSATAGDAQIRHSLCDEAIRIVRILLPRSAGEPEVSGLLALMLLHDSRRAARVDDDGQMVALEDQDRSLWRKDAITEGIALVEDALRSGAVGPYQLQAAISAVHAEAASMADTRWDEIAGLYGVLYRMRPNPVVLLNQAVALSYAGSPHDGLAAMDALADQLMTYQPFHAARADCLRQAGRFSDAAEAYKNAISLSSNAQERVFLTKRRDSLKL